MTGSFFDNEWARDEVIGASHSIGQFDGVPVSRMYNVHVAINTPIVTCPADVVHAVEQPRLTLPGQPSFSLATRDPELEGQFPAHESRHHGAGRPGR